MQPPPRPQVNQQQSQPDVFLQLLQGPVVAVIVGSGLYTPKYYLPIALLCHHSYFFRHKISSYESLHAQVDINKKRKLSVEDGPTATEVKKEDSKSEVRSTQGQNLEMGEMVIMLADIDPMIFGLFLKFVYTGFYPAAVDAPLGGTRPVPFTTTSTQHDTPYTPAKAVMPPPANINFRQTPPGGEIPQLPTSNPAVLSQGMPLSYNQVPPSIRAYLLSVHLGAAAFMNQALNHIYYGIGKYFALTPSLIDYVWDHTSPTDKMLGPSPLRRLFLDVLVVHWPSSTTHIIVKHPALNALWNDVLDKHRDLRHVFTMGLQGNVKVLPVQVYFASTAVLSVASKENSREQEVEVVEIKSAGIDTSAVEAAAMAAANKQRDAGYGADGGEKKE